MVALERVVVIVLCVLAIILTLLLAIAVLAFCVAKELFLQVFPSLYGKHTSPDYVRGEVDDQ